MKHIQVIELSRLEQTKEQEFDLVLEELEERHEFGTITPCRPDPGCCGCGGACADPPLPIGGGEFC
jgi:hypothetical protein